MDHANASSSSSDERAEATTMQALPARRPAVLRTYGKLKPAPTTFSTTTTSAAPLHAEQSFTSDLTSLSQLSQVQRDDDDDFDNDDGANKEDNDAAAHDSGIALYESSTSIGPHKNIRDMLREVDEAFDDDDDTTDAAASAILAEKARQGRVAPALETVTSAPLHERVSSAASTALSDSSSLFADREQHGHSGVADTTTTTKGATSALDTTAHNTDEDVEPRRSDGLLHSSPPTSPRSHAQALVDATMATEKTKAELVVSTKPAVSAAETKHEVAGAHSRVVDSDDDNNEEQSSAEAAPRRRMLATGRKSGRVLDSDDEDEMMMTTRAGADSDEEELPTLKDAAVARKSKSKSKSTSSSKGKLFASDSEEQDDEDEEEETPETQKTEDIESYNDNTPQSQLYQTKTAFSQLVDEDDDDEDEDEEDGRGVTYKQRKKAERKKTAAAAADKKKEKEKKVKPLSKKAMEEMHRVAEQAKRSRQASIMPRSRPARPLSEISQRIHNKDLSGRPSVAASARPSLTRRPRSGSAKPALDLRAASVPFSSLLPPNPTTFTNHASKSSRAGTPATTATAAATASRAPIEIGSSSAIFDYNPDEDSYDPSYLRDQESQSQSQAESQTQAPSAKAGVPSKSTASARPMMSAAPESSDEELLDIHQIVARERRKKELQSKKAAALAQIEAQQYQREQRILREQQLLLEDSDPKGKGREIVMDLDSDPDDLEVIAPRAPSPVIAGGAHKRSPRSRQLMRQLAPQSVKKERDAEQDLPESQFQRAGRTWGKGENKVVIAPHVALKESRPRNSYSVGPPGQNQSEGGGNHQRRKSKKTDQTVTKQATDRHLLEKASRQAAIDKFKRMEDWKKRGGTLRHDGPVQEMPVEDDDEEAQQQQQQGDRAKDLMDAIREEAEKAPDAGDEDDEDDGDYIGSDEEEGMFSGEDDEGSADEENEQEEGEEQGSPAREKEQAHVTVHHSDTSMEEPDLSADLSSIAPTEVVNSAASEPQEQEASDEEDENVIVARRKKHTAKRPVFDDDEEEMNPASSAASESVPRAATQYHDFFIKGNAEAFPEAGSLEDISLTQAFGQAVATQAPQASRAVFDDEDGFSQMFGGDDEAFTQTQAVLPTGKAKEGAPLPSMFRPRNSDSSPELQRHVLGEAPMLLDAALRDAQIREEAERAFDELQARKAKSPVNRQEERDLTRTPASTVSEEMPPLPFVTMPGGRYSESAASENELDQTEPQDVDEDGSTPLQPRRLLRRANTEDREAAQSDQEDSPEKPRNAFDALKEGQHRVTSGAEARAKQLQKRKNRSEFVAEEVEESEDEGGYSMLRKIGEEEEDEDDSDLDKEVEGLVDDQKGDAEEEAEQDRLARAKHEELLAADDAKMQKHVQKVVDGKMKKRRRGDGHGGELSDSDYEDDAYYRAAKAKKAKQYSGKMEALADNAETQAFARAGMDDGTEDLTGDWMMEQDATSDAPSEPEELSDMEGADPVRKRSERYHYVEEYTESSYEENEDAIELAAIDRQIWGVPSSPVYETQVQDTLLSIAAKHMTKTRIAEDFDDLETHYSVETQLFKRREVKMDKEESQNERGVGPGRSSAVTSFVRKNDKKAGAGGAKQSRPTVPSAIHSKLASRKSVQTLPAAGAPGRLAAARQGKR